MPAMVPYVPSVGGRAGLKFIANDTTCADERKAREQEARRTSRARAANVSVPQLGPAWPAHPGRCTCPREAMLDVRQVSFAAPSFGARRRRHLLRAHSPRPD